MVWIFLPDITNMITKLRLCKLGTVKLLHNFKSTVWSSHTNSTFIPCRWSHCSEKAREENVAVNMRLPTAGQKNPRFFSFIISFNHFWTSWHLFSWNKKGLQYWTGDAVSLLKSVVVPDTIIMCTLISFVVADASSCTHCVWICLHLAKLKWTFVLKMLEWILFRIHLTTHCIHSVPFCWATPCQRLGNNNSEVIKQ